jgi:hypothetical protein
MRPKASQAERLLLLTLTLESAVEAEDWSEVSDILNVRNVVLDCLEPIPAVTARDICAAEERMLTSLRRRLVGVRADMRNLSAALRIAAPYSREQSSGSLSLAG